MAGYCTAVDIDPVWDIVVVGVAVIKKAAMLHEQFAGVDACTIAAVPADRRLAACPGKGVERKPDMFAFLIPSKAKDLFPSISVAADFVTCAHNLGRNLGVLFERDGASEEG